MKSSVFCNHGVFYIQAGLRKNPTPLASLRKVLILLLNIASPNAEGFFTRTSAMIEGLCDALGWLFD